jgi:Ras-related protein Rab-11A
MILVGNKSDLKERQVSVSEANEYAQKEEMAYIESSAALNVNIDKIFEMLSGKIYQIYKQRNQKNNDHVKGQMLSTIHQSNGQRKKSKKCC